jgi:hypothetical protein
VTWRERFASQFLSARKVTENITQSFDRSIETIQKPYNAVVPPAAPLDPISANFAYERDYRFNEGREIVPFNVLLLRFALRAYRLETANSLKLWINWRPNI